MSRIEKNGWIPGWADYPSNMGKDGRMAREGDSQQFPNPIGYSLFSLMEK